MDAPTDLGPDSTSGATPLPSGPPAGRPGPRRIRRRPDDGHIAGVCAGVAEYFNVDPVIVRIAAVVLLFSGPGFFAYILAWIFVPEAKGSVPYGAPRAPVDRKDRATQIFGIVLLALALSVIWGDWWSPARRWLFPIGLIAVGGWLLLRRDKNDDQAPGVPPAPSPTAWEWSAAPTEVTDQTAVTASLDVATTDPDPAEGHLVAAPGDADGTTVFDDPTSTLLRDGDAAGGGPPRAPWDLPPSPVPPEAPTSSRRRRVLGPVVFGALLIWSALAWLTDVSVETGLAVGLLIIGIGFVLGAFVGGSRALILPALLVGGALALTAVVDIPLSGPVGEQHWAPRRVADVEDRYEVSIGEGTLDLSAIDLSAGRRLQIDASVGIGNLIVLAPEDLALDVDTEVGAGESQVLDHQQSGVGVSTSQYNEDGVTGGTLELHLRVGMGQIEVRRVGSTTTSTTRTLG